MGFSFARASSSSSRDDDDFFPLDIDPDVLDEIDPAAAPSRVTKFWEYSKTKVFALFALLFLLKEKLLSLFTIEFAYKVVDLVHDKGAVVILAIRNWLVNVLWTSILSYPVYLYLIPMPFLAAAAYLFYAVTHVYRATRDRVVDAWSGWTKAKRLAGIFLAATISGSLLYLFRRPLAKAFRKLKKSVSRDNENADITGFMGGVLDIAVATVGTVAFLGGSIVLMHQVRFVAFLAPIFNRILRRGESSSSISLDVKALRSAVVVWRRNWMTQWIHDDFAAVWRAIPQAHRYFRFCVEDAAAVLDSSNRLSIGNKKYKFILRGKYYYAVDSKSIWKQALTGISTDLSDEAYIAAAADRITKMLYTPKKDASDSVAAALTATSLSYKATLAASLLNSEANISRVWAVVSALVPSLAGASVVALVVYFGYKAIRDIQNGTDETFTLASDDYDWGNQAKIKVKHSNDASALMQKALHDDAVHRRAFGPDRECITIDDSVKLLDSAENLFVNMRRGVEAIRAIWPKESSNMLPDFNAIHFAIYDGDGHIASHVIAQPIHVPYSQVWNGDSTAFVESESEYVKPTRPLIEEIKPEAEVISAPRLPVNSGTYPVFEVCSGNKRGSGFAYTIASRKLLVTCTHNLDTDESTGYVGFAFVVKTPKGSPMPFSVIYVEDDICVAMYVGATGDYWDTVKPLTLCKSNVNVNDPVVIVTPTLISSGNIQAEPGYGDGLRSASYTSKSGDSGSPVMKAASESNLKLIGMHAASGRPNVNNCFIPLTPKVVGSLERAVNEFFARLKAKPSESAPKVKGSSVSKEASSSDNSEAKTKATKSGQTLDKAQVTEAISAFLQSEQGQSFLAAARPARN